MARIPIVPTRYVAASDAPMRLQDTYKPPTVDLRGTMIGDKMILLQDEESVLYGFQTPAPIPTTNGDWNPDANLRSNLDGDATHTVNPDGTVSTDGAKNTTTKKETYKKYALYAIAALAGWYLLKS
jgi:hypothetical protein